MADGTSYDIDIAANAVGFTTSAEELNRLAGALDAAGATSTQFDAAIARTGTLLVAASAASADAAEAVASGATRYKQLEVAAERAARAVDKATAAGTDTTALQATAAGAAAALTAQGTTLDALRAKASAAAAEERTLADTMRSLQAEAKATARVAESSGAKEAETFKRALGPYGEKLERLKAMRASFCGAGVAAIGAAALWLVAAAALVAVATAAATAVWELAKFAVTSNKVAMASLDKTLAKAKKGFAALFTGVRVDGFTDAAKEVLSVFDEGSSEARAMRTLVETILNPLFDAAKVLGPYVKQMFRGILFAALQAAIAVVTLRNAVLRAIPDSVQAAIAAVAASVDWMGVAFYGSAIVAGVLAIAIGVLAVVVGVVAVAAVAALIVALVFMAIPIIVSIVVVGLLIAAIVAIGYALYSAAVAIADFVGGLWDFASEAAGAGANLVSSFVAQIESGVGMVAAAMRNLGTQGINALASALGIASPSKYAKAFALNVTDTMSDTTDEGAPKVRASLRGIVGDVPADGAPGAPGAAPGAARGGASVALTGPFNFYGVEGAEDAESRFEAMLTRVLEGDALQAGAAA